MNSRSPDRFVPLKGGYLVPAEALRLLWTLEDEGFTFRVDADGALFVSPSHKLTAEQVAQLRHWKRHVVALVLYQPADEPNGHPRKRIAFDSVKTGVRRGKVRCSGAPIRCGVAGDGREASA